MHMCFQSNFRVSEQHCKAYDNEKVDKEQENLVIRRRKIQVTWCRLNN